MRSLSRRPNGCLPVRLSVRLSQSGNVHDVLQRQMTRKWYKIEPFLQHLLSYLYLLNCVLPNDQLSVLE